MSDNQTQVQTTVTPLNPRVRLPVLTPTRLKLWTRCRRLYGYVEVAGIKSPPNWAMVGGTAIDATLNEHHTQRISGTNGLRGTALTDYFRESLRKTIQQFSPSGDPDSDVETDGVRLLPIYEKKMDPVLTPLEVQKTIEWTIPGNKYVQPFKMQGHLDLLSSTSVSEIIDDHKFTSRAPNPNTCATSMQMWGYDLGLEFNNADQSGNSNTKHYRRTEHHTRLIHLVRRKRDPDVVTTSHFVTEENRQDFIRMAQEAAIQIQAGYFPPTDPGNFMVCSPTQCGLWSRCRGRREGPEPIPGEVLFNNA